MMLTPRDCIVLVYCTESTYGHLESLLENVSNTNYMYIKYMLEAYICHNIRPCQTVGFLLIFSFAKNIYDDSHLP